MTWSCCTHFVEIISFEVSSLKMFREQNLNLFSFDETFTWMSEPCNTRTYMNVSVSTYSYQPIPLVSTYSLLNNIFTSSIPNTLFVTSQHFPRSFVYCKEINVLLKAVDTIGNYSK